MGLKWQRADVLPTVTHRTTSANLCGYWQGAAARISEQVWTPETETVTPRYLR